MIVSELLAELQNRTQTAQLVVVEMDIGAGPGDILTIESVLGDNDGNVTLVGKLLRRRPIDEFLSRLVEDLEQGKPTKVFKTDFHKSERDGKYEVTIDGKTIQSGMDTAQEAKQFARGFVLGFEMGSTGKRLGSEETN